MEIYSFLPARFEHLVGYYTIILTAVMTEVNFRNRVRFWEDGVMGKGKIKERKLLGIAGVAWLFDAMDVGMLSFIIAALQKEWNLNTEQMGWIGSVNSIGMAVGALVFGIWADRIGRKNVLIIKRYIKTF